MKTLTKNYIQTNTNLGLNAMSLTISKLIVRILNNVQNAKMLICSSFLALLENFLKMEKVKRVKYSYRILAF